MGGGLHCNNNWTGRLQLSAYESDHHSCENIDVILTHILTHLEILKLYTKTKENCITHFQNTFAIKYSYRIIVGVFSHLSKHITYLIRFCFMAISLSARTRDSRQQ